MHFASFAEDRASGAGWKRTEVLVRKSRRAIDYLERSFEFISKTLRNPQNAAREFLAADFCTVSNFFFEVAYSFVDRVQRECARHRPAPS
ncbi:hypothetical protein ABH973_000850 [Bradyrhizobium ottawaense]